MAQLVEYDLAKVGVAGSSPVCRSSFSKFDTHATVAQLVEYNLAKVGVAGSSPVCRSKKHDSFGSCFSFFTALPSATCISQSRAFLFNKERSFLPTKKDTAASCSILFFYFLRN